jgi:hypothetical protein
LRCCVDVCVISFRIPGLFALPLPSTYFGTVSIMALRKDCKTATPRVISSDLECQVSVGRHFAQSFHVLGLVRKRRTSASHSKSISRYCSLTPAQSSPGDLLASLRSCGRMLHPELGCALAKFVLVVLRQRRVWQRPKQCLETAFAHLQ